MPKSRRTNKKDPILCDFNRVEISIPRVRLIKLAWKRGYLDYDETIFLRALTWRVEAAINKLLHVQSLAEKALLKSGGKRVT